MKILNHDEFVELIQQSCETPADFIDDYITEVYELFETSSVIINVKGKELVLSLKVEQNKL